MQIRLGNRQDEPAITDLVYTVMKEFKLAVNPEGAESDLKNIEAGYFARDGIFLVAEQDGQIVGIAGARRASEQILELVRVAVARQWRRQGIARKLVSTVLSFAADLGYERVQVEPARQYPGSDQVLMRFGFTSDPGEDAQQPWYYRLERSGLRA